MTLTDKKNGHYIGTEIDEKWWRRHTKDNLLARGNGEYWIDSEAFYFKRALTKDPIKISLADIQKMKTGKWHSGRWAGGAPVVKIVWKKNDQDLSSGFVISKDKKETKIFIQTLLELKNKK